MKTSDRDERETDDSARPVISHSKVDEAAGDEGIDDAQPDETEAASS